MAGGCCWVGRQRLWVIRLDPDQTNSDQFILTCSIFWIFVLLVILAETILYRTAFHANALIRIEYNLVTLSQYICYCAWLCLNDFRGRKALPGRLGGTLRGQSDSVASLLIQLCLIPWNTVQVSQEENIVAKTPAIGILIHKCVMTLNMYNGD